MCICVHMSRLQPSGVRSSQLPPTPHDPTGPVSHYAILYHIMLYCMIICYTVVYSMHDRML